MAVDTIAFWRPWLLGRPGKLFCQLVGKTMTSIGFGLVADVGQVGKRLPPLIRAIFNGHEAGQSEMSLKVQTVARSARLLKEKKVLLHDGGISVGQLQAADAARFVVLLVTN